MIAVYAFGGGLGHLTRVRALLHTLGATEPVTVITTAGLPALDPRILGDAAVLALPADLARRAGTTGVRGALRTALHDLAPTTVVIDAFPAGILGELDATCVPAGTPVVHAARNLRWDAYRPRLPADPLPLHTTYVVEPLDPRHLEHLHDVSARVEALELQDPPGPARTREGLPVTADDVRRGPSGPNQGRRRPDRPLWLVVHSGPATETDELVAYARAEAEREGVEPDLVVVSPGPAEAREASPRAGAALGSGGSLGTGEVPGSPTSLGTGIADTAGRPGSGPPAPAWCADDLVAVDVYPAAPLMGGADRVFTGGGCNAVRDVIGADAVHRALPFPRRFDDQAARLARTADRRRTHPPAAAGPAPD